MWSHHLIFQDHVHTHRRIGAEGKVGGRFACMHAIAKTRSRWTLQKHSQSGGWACRVVIPVQSSDSPRKHHNYRSAGRPRRAPLASLVPYYRWCPPRCNGWLELGSSGERTREMGHGRETNDDAHARVRRHDMSEKREAGWTDFFSAQVCVRGGLTGVVEAASVSSLSLCSRFFFSSFLRRERESFAGFVAVGRDEPSARARTRAWIHPRVRVHVHTSYIHT